MTDFRALCAELVPYLQGRKDDEYGWPGLDPEHELLDRARDALAQPEPQRPTDEELEDLADAMNVTGDPVPAMRRALELWSRPAIEPVPVSERLPGPADCDEEGRCFVWDHVSAEWRFLEIDIFDYGWPESYWLPHHALPVPQQEGGND